MHSLYFSCRWKKKIQRTRNNLYWREMSHFLFSIFLFFWFVVDSVRKQKRHRTENLESCELRKRNETKALRINVGLHEIFLDNTALLWNRRAKSWEDWAKGADPGRCVFTLFLHYCCSHSHLQRGMVLSRVLRLTFTLSAGVFAFDAFTLNWIWIAHSDLNSSRKFKKEVSGERSKIGREN